MRKNAIILAAGKSNRFAPFTYERPKGLFRVKNEILIERLISQLFEAKISEIFIVVGYMKEKFFYLEQKYKNVHLIINNNFSVKGNLYSLYVARKHLDNTFLCYADNYFAENPFLDENKENFSYHSGVFVKGKVNSFSANYSDANIITEIDYGGENKISLIGFSYFNSKFSALLRNFLDKEINDFRVASLFCEEYFKRHIRELTLYLKKFQPDFLLEFNSIEELRQFDSDFLYNIDSEIISHITQTLNCKPNEITNINVINAGLTNVSFSFTANSKQYVYRHPGGTAGNLIDRSAEYVAQKKAKELGIDKSFIKMDKSGWKISYFVQNLVPCDFRSNRKQLKKGMEYLRKIHEVSLNNLDEPVKEFDDFCEGLKLMKIASSTKGNLLDEFSVEIAKAEKLSDLLKKEADNLGIKKNLCHNDTYEPNFLASEDGNLFLIDWEYAGINDPANDLACFFCRSDFTDEQINFFIDEYLEKSKSIEEKSKENIAAHFKNYIPLCAFYWFCWGLYKGSVGDDDGFFFLPAYRNFHRFIDKALKNFGEKI